MKIRAVLTLLLFMLVLQGCVGGRNSDRLSGQWECDARATLELMHESGKMTETQFEVGVAVLQSMSLEIDAKERTMVLQVGSVKETSPFTLKVTGRNSFLLEINNALVAVEIRDKDSILLTDSRTPNRTVVFTRRR